MSDADPGVRRLAAIVFSDVVSYTAHMAESEASGLRLRELHRELWSGGAGAHGGEIVDENGDELVLIFPSALEAVRCAREVNAAAGAGGTLQLRIGVHSGDILVRDGKIYGAAVNVAARIRAEAEPDQIVVSAEIARSIRNQPGIGLRGLGERRLKNVPEPVAMHVLTELAATAPSARGAERRRWLRRVATAIAALLAVLLLLGLALPDARNRLVAVTLLGGINLLPGPSDHKIAFATSADGTRIAWGAYGKGPPILVVQTWFTDVESFPRAFRDVTALAAEHRIVHYDGRGFGLSQRGVAHSARARLDDLDAVVSASGLERFSIFGISAGSPTAIAWAGLHPKQVERLALFGATVALSRDDPAVRAALLLMREYFGTDRFASFFRDFLIPGALPFQVMFFEEVLKQNGNRDDVANLWDSLLIDDASDLARKVKAPTLVVHVRDDRLIPLAAALEVVQLIPGAELLILEGQNHVLLPGDKEGERLRRALAEFFAPSAPPPPPPPSAAR